MRNVERVNRLLRRAFCDHRGVWVPDPIVRVSTANGCLYVETAFARYRVTVGKRIRIRKVLAAWRGPMTAEDWIWYDREVIIDEAIPIPPGMWDKFLGRPHLPEPRRVLATVATPKDGFTTGLFDR